MRIFRIEAYGGIASTNGAIHHFAVQAETPDDAIRLVRHSIHGQKYGRFEVVDISDETEADEAAILDESDRPHQRTL